MSDWDEFKCELERYRDVSSSIHRRLRSYEKRCDVLIEEISRAPSYDEASMKFDVLHEVQRELSTVRYRFEFPLSDELSDFVYHMDRDDGYSRRYWYERFRAGERWPVE